MEKRKYTDIHFEAFFSVWHSGIMLKNMLRQFFYSKGTTEAQFNVLMLLKYAAHPMTQKELSELLLVDKSDLSGLVDRMESAGLIKRGRAENDRRSYHLQITGKSMQMLDDIELPYRELLHRVMSSFSGEELLSMTELMTKLQKVLDNRCSLTGSGFHMPETEE
ncbi:MAG: MarR family transcriptional regulator [Lentisphaeria bacterium]|nr:MarR family transcriptional regulator [Lentisphaeria bacterium]